MNTMVLGGLALALSRLIDNLGVVGPKTSTGT